MTADLITKHDGFSLIQSIGKVHMVMDQNQMSQKVPIRPKVKKNETGNRLSGFLSLVLSLSYENTFS